MFCPKCRAEYRDGFTVCADCGVPLVETLPSSTEFDPVFFFETEGDCAWELPALLRRAGVACYLYGGNGMFIRMEEDQTVPGQLYVDRQDLLKAKQCLNLLSGPPVPVEENDLIEAYDAYMAEGPQTEDETTGDAVWKLFLIMAVVVAAWLVYLLFFRVRRL